MLKLTVKSPARLPDGMTSRTLSLAAAQGVQVSVVRHLRRRHSTASRRAGFPQSGYWLDAAASTTTAPAGDSAEVTVEKEGVALHYYGGTVHPVKGKALAIPIDPSVAGKNPRELNGLSDTLALLWPKNSNHGFLKDTETSELLYLLVGSARLKADRSVLPEDGEMAAEAEEAMANAIMAMEDAGK